MSLCCELSGAAPVEPVVSPTGHLFEKRVIESHLEKNATCPISGKPLSKKDLIPIAHTTIKRPSAILAGDPSSLLKAVQDHIDVLQLENYRLLQERDHLRQQVTQLLYLRDGSTRVVAQKLEEIKLLQNRISALESGASQLSAAVAQPVAASAEELAALVAKWDTLSAGLLQARKKRDTRAPPVEDMAQMKANQMKWNLGEDVTCFDLLLTGIKDNKGMPCLLASGTASGRVNILNLVSDEMTASLTGHSGRVTAIKTLVYPTVADLSSVSLAALRASSDSCAPFQSCFNILTGGEDGTVRHWAADDLKQMDEIEWMMETDSVRGPVKLGDADGRLPRALDWSCQHVFRFGSQPIRAIDLHPSGTHAGILSEDEKWTLVDLVASQVVCNFKCPGEQIVDLAIQPDGMIAIGVSMSNTIPVWDMRTREVKATPAAVVPGHICSVKFSENGYHALTATTSGQALLWDLRKSEVAQTLDLPGPGVQSRFDHSGKYIVSATENGAVLHGLVEKKKYGEIAKLSDEKCVDCRFDKLTDDFILTLAASGELTMLTH